MKRSIFSLIAFFISTNLKAQDASDFQVFLQAFSAGDQEIADFNRDGSIDQNDMVDFTAFFKAKGIQSLETIEDAGDFSAEVDRLYYSAPWLLEKYYPEVFQAYDALINGGGVNDPNSGTNYGLRGPIPTPRVRPEAIPAGNVAIAHHVTWPFECLPRPGSSYGLGKAFPKTGPIDWNSPNYSFVNPMTVCFHNLGVYDENGYRIGSNDGVLNGKYLRTGLTSFAYYFPQHGSPYFERVYDHSNDFRVNFQGDANFPATPQEAVGWSAEVNAYYHIDEYRRKYLNESFLNSLGLDPETVHNVLHRQYRPDLVGLQQTTTPRMALFELVSDYNFEIDPFLNGFVVPFRMRWGDYASLPPMSKTYDPSLTVGEYAGLVGFWVIGDNRGFLPEDGFGEGNSWISNISPALNDALNIVEGMRYTNEDEVFRYNSYVKRMWLSVPCDGTHVPCGKGNNLDNVMMFEPGNNSKNMVFPFSHLPGLLEGQGPIHSDLSAIYFGAIYRDIAKEAGLGLTRASQLMWKTLSLITNRNEVPMRRYGELMIEAARQLWPSDQPAGSIHTPPGQPSDMMSIYEQDIVDVLTFRGIPTYGRATFQEALPPAIGEYPATLERNVPNAFGAGHPETHPGLTQYGVMPAQTLNGYHHPEVADYVAYQTWRFGIYGPCDELRLTDGTFSPTNGDYNEDGSYYLQLRGREVANKIILAPGNHIRWNRVRGRCDNENEGYYVEDVRPFGFRTIKAVSEGFGFETRYLGTASGGKLRYELNIVDPSFANEGGTYDWSFTDAHGNETSVSGTTVEYQIARDESFKVHIVRTRNSGQVDLEMKLRSNDLHRESGKAHIINLID